MERKEDILKTKYFKIHEVIDLKDLIFKSAKMYKKRTAFRLKDKDGKIYSISYTKFKNDIVSLGTALLNLGLKGETVSLIGRNSYPWITSYFACAITGVIAPIDKELHVNDIINFINISESKAVICDSKYVKSILENKSKLKNEVVLINIDDDLIDGVLNFNKLLEDGNSCINNRKCRF